MLLPLLIGYFTNWEMFREASDSADRYNWDVVISAVMFTIHFTGLFMLTGSFALDKVQLWNSKYTVWISISSMLLVLAFYITMAGAENAETEAYYCYILGLTGYFTLLIKLYITPIKN